ncbi:MAG: zinc ABC transporter substrate-binding protein [Acholeplasmataceae bacterium]|nr:zinc ABC transporter substrate-binding protein [Acholeplasmataceae bacterium]
MFLAGCGRDNKQNNTATNKNFVVVTSFYPMYISTINITRDVPGVEVINMTKPQTGCLHDYQLVPDDVQKLEKASAFVVNGAGMAAFMDKAVKQQPKLKIVDASKGIVLLKNESGEENPHVWVSVSNAIIQVKNIAEQLAALDPANAEKYKSNADVYTKKLESLREDMHSNLDNVKTKNIITFHEAFPYFAKEFNLNIIDVIEREPGTEPSPKELEETISKVKQLKVKALFVEPQYPAKAAEVIAKETGAKVFILNPAVTGESKPDAYDDYIIIMKKNLDVLKEALQ